MDIDIRYRKYEKMIRDAFTRKCYKETPTFREICVYWHIGKPGSGKSHTYTELCDDGQAENVYFVTDYKNGFDKYNGEKILFMDEFRGEMPFNTLLSILGGY